VNTLVIIVNISDHLHTLDVCCRKTCACQQVAIAGRSCDSSTSCLTSCM